MSSESVHEVAKFEVAKFFKTPADSTAFKESSLKAGDQDVAIKDFEHTQTPATFQDEIFFTGLKTRQLGRTLLTTALISSTQTLLHQNFANFPDGTVCLADQQSTGKGRGGNTWTSPSGCLMFSVYKHLQIEGQRLPFVQYVVSLAIVQAVQDIGKELGQEQAAQVRIKWPNDLYFHDLKIGGILCQSIYRDGGFHLIIGAGVNVNNREPTTCLAAILGLQDVSREDALAAILNRLEALLDALATDGFGAIKGAYLEAWLHSGQQVTLEEKKNGQVEIMQLTITGISESGYMTAVDSRGEVFELHPDGNSFDFFAGLVRQKAAS